MEMVLSSVKYLTSLKLRVYIEKRQGRSVIDHHIQGFVVQLLDSSYNRIQPMVEMKTLELLILLQVAK